MANTSTSTNTNKIIYLAGLTLLTFAAAGASVRRAAVTRADVVIRQQGDGGWQMWVFGPGCDKVGDMRVVYPADPKTQPIEIECDGPGAAAGAGAGEGAK